MKQVKPVKQARYETTSAPGRPVRRPGIEEVSILRRMAREQMVLFGNSSRETQLYLRPPGTDNMGICYRQPVPAAECIRMLETGWIEPMDPSAPADQPRWFRISGSGLEQVRNADCTLPVPGENPLCFPR